MTYHEWSSHSHRNEYSTDRSQSPPTVFIVDWSALDRDCHLLKRILSYIIVESELPTSSSKHTFLLLLDASASSQTKMCYYNHDGDSNSEVILPQLLSNTRMRLVKRSIITQRRFNYTQQWIESGSFIPNPITATPITPYDTNHDSDAPSHVYQNHILHWSGYVTQSYVQLLDRVVNDFTKRSSRRYKTKNRRRQRRRTTTETYYNRHDRPIDVTHYWKSTNGGGNHEHPHYYYYNRLRQTVQRQINQTRMAMTQSSPDHSQTQDVTTESSRWVEYVGIDTKVEFVPEGDSSADGTEHRNGDDSISNDNKEEKEVDTTAVVQSSVHVAVLASSKIVVVTQSDEYEDHDTRLFEALASGAMVLCDTMMAPPLGLVHKTNIVFFHSTSKLDQYLQYYLDPRNELQRQEIARHGLEYALGRHRSWHGLEAVLFGKALTRTDPHPLMDDGPKLRPSTTQQTLPIVVTL